MKKVSVIIPIYNVEKYLRDCLDSVLAQTLHDIECICIDDGSTDRSREIAEEYVKKDSRFQLYCKTNGGLSSARNYGLAKALGKYVYFLDSDDSITSDALETLYMKAENNNLDIILFDAKTVYENDKLKALLPEYETAYERRGFYKGVYSGGNIFIKLISNRDFIMSACLQFIRRSYLQEQELLFYEGILYEDNLFTFKNLLNAERVEYLDKKLYRRRMRENSIMTAPKANFYQFYSRYKCYMEILKCVLSLEDGELKQAATKYVQGLFKSVVKKYNQISHHNLNPDDMKLLRTGLDSVEKMLLGQLGFEFPSMCLFPYKLVQPESKIVLYGAGKIGKYYYNQICNSKYCELVLWADRNYKNILENENLPVGSPDEIQKTVFDSVLIAIEEESIANSIKKYLIQQGIKESIILWEKPQYISV